MTLDQLQTDLHAASAAVDARLARDAETIRVLTNHVKRLGGIETDYVHPPIPTKAFDWTATYEGYDPDGKEDRIGRGPTELAAILDLLER